MYVKIEPSGCVERKGLVQIRFCMYLEPGDYGYDIHHVQVPIIPKAGYQGEKDSEGSPVDWDAYDTWQDALPKEWRDNPFHNHFIYVEPDTSDEEIMDIGEAHLNESYVEWALDRRPEPKNPRIKYPASFNKSKIKAKVQHLKAIKLERKL